ncbi:hypothetical protein SERLADRAFT_384098, partial [Serpula lacrymans var. lacrymans S7.9]
MGNSPSSRRPATSNTSPSDFDRNYKLKARTAAEELEVNMSPPVATPRHRSSQHLHGHSRTMLSPPPNSMSESSSHRRARSVNTL